jgi:gliding motility-associated-like protein
MKNKYIHPVLLPCLICLGLCISFVQVHAQGCVNADFSEGNFTGWTGTYSLDQCSEVESNGNCKCSPTNPYNSTGFNQGPNDDPVNDRINEWNQIITTSAGGNDVNLVNYGFNMPTVWAGDAYSARIGNMWQDVSDAKTGDGESISYSFVVTPSNANFIYHYAVVLFNGNHTEGEQAYFNIHMFAGNGDTVTCATYEVDATTAAIIGGFTASADSVFYKPWSSVVVPLVNYIGQTVTITFTTRGCIPKGCAGKHYAYAYISAECAPSELTATAAVDCGQPDTLTAPAGSATYSWTGPGIVGSSTNQQVIIDEPGEYVVNMTTHGNVPCNFSVDTLIAGTNPKPNFVASFACKGDPVDFHDISTPAGGISSWQWSFGDGGTSTARNPTHTYSTTGTFPVTLTIVAGPCTKDATMNITVVLPPTSTFTVVSPECEGSNSNIVYTGNAPPGYSYTWDFDGGTGIPLTGPGPLNISWQIPGIKTIILVVSNGGCYSLPDTQTVLVKPYPGMTLTPYTTICVGSSAVLNAANATIYTWAANPTLSNTDSSTVVATPLVTTTYSVTGSNSNCITLDTVTVAVFNYPTARFTATGPVCIGQNSTVTYTGNGGSISTYNWNFNGGTAVPDTGQGPLLVNWLTPGNHDITLNVANNGCDSAITNVVNVFSSPPHPALTADTLTGCPNVEVCFTSAPVGNTIGYIWNFGDGDTSGTQNTCHSYLAAGVYSVSFQVALSPECIYDTTMNDLINVIPDPVAAFTSSATVIQPPLSLVSFTNQSQNAVKYLWNFSVAGNGNQSIGTSTDFNSQFNFTQYGQYNTTLYAYNQLGCPDSMTQGLTVLPSEDYFIPNAFTPNGDGVNDVFYVEMQEGATLLSFQIFDRWGEKVHDGLYPWDGNYKGEKAPEGVYVYRINIHLIDLGQDEEKRGSVTLLR